jgi:hypothetical protein
VRNADAEPDDLNPIVPFLVKDGEPRPVLPPTDDPGRPLFYVFYSEDDWAVCFGR